MRGKVILALRPLHAVAVENKAGSGAGTPDVNCVAGWIELKWKSYWPKKPETPVVLTRFTLQQRRWLARRWARGGGAWLLIQCKREWLLFSGNSVADMDTLTIAEMRGRAYKHWTAGLDKEELIRCLRKNTLVN